MFRFQPQTSLLSVGLALAVRAAPDPPPPGKTIPGPHVGSPPPLTSYTTYLQQDIAGKKHAFLAGNNVYYMSQGRWGNPGNDDDETIGLIHPFFNDLRSRGTGIVEHETTGVGNDFWGWDFHKFVEVARGAIIGGDHTGGSDSDETNPILIANHDGTLCVAAHPTQDHFGLPVSMEACDDQDPLQQWMHDGVTGLFTNQVKGWCLFAGRPDLVGQQLKTWGCDSSNPQMIWDFHQAYSGRIKSRSGFNEQYNDGKCVKAGDLAGDIPTTGVCDETLPQHFALLPISTEVRYENIRPDKMYWRPDGMTIEYAVGPDQVTVREEKFVSNNDVISTTIYSDIPIEIEFTGKSFARDDYRTVSTNATCGLDATNNAVHVVEGGRVLAKVSESPEVIKEADLMYTGMSTVLSSSRLIEKYVQTELGPGECRYTFRLPVDSAGTTLSWTMHDDYGAALGAIQEVLAKPMDNMLAKTEVMNHLLNYNVPFFRCSNEDIVKVYYYLWAIYLMLFKYVGKGQEIHHHTQTAVNNFLGMHNWDAVMQILVGSWTTDKPTWAYGNVLLWSELPLNATSIDGMVPDNMGQAWNSGLFGGFHHWAHACGAWQIYEHTGDNSFLLKSYSFFDNLFTKAGGVYGEDFDASMCLGKMAKALGRPDTEVAKWDAHMERYGGLDWYLAQRWDETRSCFLDCDESSPNGIHRWGQIGVAYQSFFPDEWARAMGETWLAKGNPHGFYPDGDIPLLSIAKRDWDKVLCPGTLDTTSCGKGYWSEFAVTPDTNFYMIQGMFRHDVTKVAIDATLGHLKLNNMQWGVPVAPESREADFALWGDQYSNFNAGKILLLIEGIGGFKVSVSGSTFEQLDRLPMEWSYMEWRMPVRAVDATNTVWVQIREERFCSSSPNIWTKQIKVESNPLDTLVVNPWTEGATVISSEVYVNGQKSNAEAEIIPDRLGFRLDGEDAQSSVTISIVLEASPSTDLSGISCTTMPSPPPSSPPQPTNKPTSTPSETPTNKPTPNYTPPPNNPTSKPTSVSKGCFSKNYKDCLPKSYSDGPVSCNTVWLSDGPHQGCIALWGDCTEDSSSCCGDAMCFRDADHAACVPPADSTSSPTPKPTTLEPTPLTCTVCDDKETDWQIANGFDCATDAVRVDRKCNKDAKWTEQGYCRLSCYGAGNGYPGDVCCGETSFDGKNLRGR